MDSLMNTTINKRRRWTKQEELFIRAHASEKPAKDIAATLNRSYNALRMRAGALKILLTSRLQKPGKHHVFPCGCAGRLPKHRGESNLFAKSTQNHLTRSWVCRLIQIFNSSKHAAKGRYVPIKATHAEIRKLMKKSRCWLCKSTLIWNLGRGRTPHLHHDHETGKVYGFTHSVCNPRALQNEIVKLRKMLDKPDRV